jgi:phosphoglucosamine mutase
MTRFFGTDGIRGAFGAPPLDEPTVRALGLALGATLAEAAAPARSRVVMAGDTRASTPTLAAWLGAGLERHGVEVHFGGVLPTPAVAYLTRELGAACGIALSASHNPYPDNGIKLIDVAGFKWSPEREEALEARLLAQLARDAQHDQPSPAAEPALAPAVDPDLARRYRASLLASLPASAPLAGLRLALDAAHGAASALAGPLFAQLGAEVEVLHAAPDGSNINLESGSTHPEALARRTAQGFDLGIAFDGDADRAILVDETGEVRDGDAILYLWARALHRAGQLEPAGIVATSMSNLGLERALAAEGIAVERCGVGDREVVATLLERGLALGGEQSGHVVHLGLASTGDGLLTALQLAALLAASGKPLSLLLAGFRRFPQVLTNVRVARKQELATLPSVQTALAAAEAELGEEGRIVLRFSGTEPLARVMIEGPNQAQIERLAGNIARAIEEALS